MSSTILPHPPEPTGTASADVELNALRAELDRLDDALHDTLMRRAEVVTKVATYKNGGAALRPGREASIIRRLLARHAGPLPRQAIPRIWRELLAATTSMQGPFLISVCEADPALGVAALAREHFGALTPLRSHRTPAQAIRDVRAGLATVAVLPVPAEDETTAETWWTALLHQDEPRIHVAGRLPFWTSRPEGAPRVQALIVSAAPPDPSGQDRTLLGLEIDPDTSRARLNAALAAVGLAPRSIILPRRAATPANQALAEVDGFVAEGDARLPAIGALLRPPVVLGAYAAPIEDAR